MYSMDRKWLGGNLVTAAGPGNSRGPERKSFKGFLSGPPHCINGEKLTQHATVYFTACNAQSQKERTSQT